MTPFYPIGTPGQPWGEDEKAQWLASITVQRSYHDEVVRKIEALSDRYDVEQYGALSYDAERYPLFAIKSRDWQAGRPKVLITGGVHGYETSGVQGALAFLEHSAGQYAGKLDIVVLPCISPWGYEVINRWNPHCVDPNRSFRADSPSQEAAAAMAYVEGLQVAFLATSTCMKPPTATKPSSARHWRPATGSRLMSRKRGSRTGSTPWTTVSARLRRFRRRSSTQCARLPTSHPRMRMA